MFAKRFFYVCVGLLCLAFVYHLGARNSQAQAPGNPVVAMSDYGGSIWVVTANGDVYASQLPGTYPWVQCPNVFTGGPVPVQPETLGRLKARYR